MLLQGKQEASGEGGERSRESGSSCTPHPRLMLSRQYFREGTNGKLSLWRETSHQQSKSGTGIKDCRGQQL